MIIIEMTFNIEDFVGEELDIVADTGSRNLVGKARYTGLEIGEGHKFYHKDPETEIITELTAGWFNRENETLYLGVMDSHIYNPSDDAYYLANCAFEGGRN